MEKESNIPRIRVTRGFIGQILLKKGLITKSQLEEALSIQKQAGGLLGDILVHNGFVSEELLYMTLAAQSDLCYIPVERYKISKDIVQFIPEEIASKYCLVPLEKIGDVLTIAIAGSLNLKEAIAAIEKATRYKAVSVIGAKTQIQRAIKLNYQA